MTILPSAHRLLLLAACSAFLIIQLDVSVVNVAIVALKSTFGASISDLQWVINSYALVFAALLIFGGALADRLGAGTAFVSGLTVFLLGSAGCMMAGNITMLIGARGLQGIGAAMLMPSSLAMIRQTFTDEQDRKQAVALWGACGGVAMAAGPLLGGLLIDYLGWRSVFAVNIPVGLAAAAAIIASTPARVPPSSDSASLMTQLLLAGALGGLTYALTGYGSRDGTGIETMLIVAVGCVVFFVRRQRREKIKVLPVRLLTNFRVMAMCLSGSAINFVFFGTLFIMSLYFQNIKGLSAWDTGLAFLPLTAVLAVATLFSSQLATRLNAISIITTGFATEIAGLLLLGRPENLESIWMMNAALVLMGTGSAFAIPSVTNTLLASTAVGDAGIAAGLLSAGRQLGGVAGVALFGRLIGSGRVQTFVTGLDRAVWLAALLLTVAILFNVTAFRHRESD